MIKFWSYEREYKKFKKYIIRDIDKTIKHGNIFFGKQLETFEKAFTKKYKAKYGIAVGSGTDALLISLKTLNLKQGDEITIDAIKNTITLNISTEEMALRKTTWIAPPLKVDKGSLYKYAKLVSPASEGCVTDNF